MVFGGRCYHVNAPLGVSCKHFATYNCNQ